MKKRKLLLLLLCAAMVISLTACDSRDYKTAQSLAESIESGSSAFEYAGYNCRVSVTDFGDDIIRLVFSVTIPELVG